MKQLFIFALTTILLASCSSFPKADGTHGCLVIGNIVLDFPDGFFSESARTIASGIRVNFTDLDENKSFFVYTSNDGYFVRRRIRTSVRAEKLASRNYRRNGYLEFWSGLVQPLF